LAEQPAALGRFYREARAAGGLEHPNIVRTHDIDQDGNLHFIVMDYVDGPNLLEVVKKFGPMDIGRACSYISQTASGLDYAFRNGLIHRDVKPGNVLIDRHGTARLLDMGLARFFQDHTDQLTIKYDDKIVLGTADYVAPEQVANSHSVDIRADIYGLGATFYFLLAGHPPFPDGTIAQKLISHQTRTPTPIRQLRPEVPEEIAEVLERMMAKSTAERYQSPMQIYEALLPWIQNVDAIPPEEEMPLLSPAARETLANTSTGSMSGSFRQDSAILRAEIMQRSGKLGASGVRPMPTADQSGVGTKVPGQGSSAIRPPFFDPPRPSQFNTPSNGGQAAAGVDTGKHATSERTSVEGQQPYTSPPVAPTQTRGNAFGSSSITRIMIEAVAAFGVLLVFWWVAKWLGLID
jgi:serine/threonine protein kinase